MGSSLGWGRVRPPAHVVVGTIQFLAGGATEALRSSRGSSCGSACFSKTTEREGLLAGRTLHSWNVMHEHVCVIHVHPVNFAIFCELEAITGPTHIREEGIPRGHACPQVGIMGCTLGPTCCDKYPSGLPPPPAPSRPVLWGRKQCLSLSSQVAQNLVHRRPRIMFTVDWKDGEDGINSRSQLEVMSRSGPPPHPQPRDVRQCLQAFLHRLAVVLG